jgi:ankyrin repeat protein
MFAVIYNTQTGDTILMRACENGQLDAVQAIVCNNIDINKTNKVS